MSSFLPLIGYALLQVPSIEKTGMEWRIRVDLPIASMSFTIVLPISGNSSRIGFQAWTFLKYQVSLDFEDSVRLIHEVGSRRTYPAPEFISVSSANAPAW